MTRIEQPASTSIKTPRHRPSWLFRVKLLSDVLFRTRGGVIALLIAVLAVISGRHLNLLSAFSPADNADNETVQTANSTTQSVTLHTAQLGNISTSLTLTGTVVPDNLLNITAPLSGLPIEQMRVASGDRVSAGETLAVLDSSVLQAQLQQAKANLAQATTELQRQEAVLTQSQVLQEAAMVDAARYGSLFEAGAISQEQLGTRQIQALTTRQEVAVANANLENAQANIDSQASEIARIEALMTQTVVTAPVAGTIAERFATIGDTASPSNPLYSLIENHQLVLELSPEQEQLADLALGMPVTISATDSATGGKQSLSFTSRIDAIEPVLDAQSRQATVKVPLPESSDQSSNQLLSGMFLQAKISTGTRRRVVVPADAVVTQPDGQALVFTLSNVSEEGIGEIQANTVEVADRSVAVSQNADPSSPSEQVEILSGLTAGSQVVVGGSRYLQAGDMARVVKREPI